MRWCRRDRAARGESRSNTARQSGVNCGFSRTRQATIRVTLGISLEQSRKTSPMHAIWSSCVPRYSRPSCALAVADPIATRTTIAARRTPSRSPIPIDSPFAVISFLYRMMALSGPLARSMSCKQIRGLCRAGIANFRPNVGDYRHPPFTSPMSHKGENGIKSPPRS
jgi:hypothetical protein